MNPTFFSAIENTDFQQWWKDDALNGPELKILFFYERTCFPVSGRLCLFWLAAVWPTAAMLDML